MESPKASSVPSGFSLELVLLPRQRAYGYETLVRFDEMSSSPAPAAPPPPVSNATVIISMPLIMQPSRSTLPRHLCTLPPAHGIGGCSVETSTPDTLFSLERILRCVPIALDKWVISSKQRIQKSTRKMRQIEVTTRYSPPPLPS